MAVDGASNLFISDSGNNRVREVLTTKLPISVAVPPGGVYSSAQTVTLSSNVPATIYYTTDGSLPRLSSNVYTGPVDISTTTMIKYFSEDTNGIVEAANNATYTIPSVAASPTGVTAVAGNGQAVVTFAAPADGGGVITGYTVTSNPGGITASGPTSPTTVSGLTNGISYTFTVTTLPGESLTITVGPGGTGGGDGYIAITW